MTSPASGGVAEGDTNELSGEDLAHCLLCAGPVQAPHCLPCGDAFCVLCLREYMELHAVHAPDPARRFLVCPTCGACAQLSAVHTKGLPESHSCARLVAVACVQHAGDRCIECKSLATAYGIKGGAAPKWQSYCSTCITAPSARDSPNLASHSNFLRGHRRMRASCRVHRTKGLGAFCVTCRRPQCAEPACAAPHSDHEMSDITQAVASGRERLKQMRECLTIELDQSRTYESRMSAALMEKKKDMGLIKIQVKEQAKSMIAQIESNKSALMRKCDNIVDEASRVHRYLSDAARYRARRMASLRQLIDALDDPARDVLLLLHADNIWRHSAALCKEGNTELPDVYRPLRTRYRYAMDPGPVLGCIEEDKKTLGPSLVKTEYVSPCAEAIWAHEQPGNVNNVKCSGQSNDSAVSPSCCAPELPVLKWSCDRSSASLCSGNTGPTGACFLPLSSQSTEDNVLIIAENESQCLTALDLHTGFVKFSLHQPDGRLSPRTLAFIPSTSKYGGEKLAVTDNLESRVKLFELSAILSGRKNHVFSSEFRGAEVIKILPTVVKWPSSSALYSPFGLSGVLGFPSELIVSDAMLQTVSRVSLDGNLVWTAGGKCAPRSKNGVSMPLFDSPGFLTVDSHNRVIVSDSRGGCVSVLGADGRLVARFGAEGQPGGVGGDRLQGPEGVCTTRRDEIILADSKNNRVQVYSSDGRVVRTLLKTVCWPFGLALSDDDQLLCVTTRDGMVNLYSNLHL